MSLLERLEADELRTLARRIVTNEVYIANQEPALSCSFGALLALTGEELMPPLQDIGALYEDYAKANPRAVNGYPTFFSCRFLHREDLPPLLETMTDMRRALGIEEAG